MNDKKIDVLGVLDVWVSHHRALAISDAYSAQVLPKAEAARAAVAELIETQRETLRMLEAAHRQLGMYSQDNPRTQRASATLARIGGA